MNGLVNVNYPDPISISSLSSKKWKTKRFKDVFKINQGLQIARSERFDENQEGRVMYITIPAIEGKIKEYVVVQNRNVLCDKTDFLVVRTGSGVGKIITNVEGAFHNNFFKSSVDKNNFKRFVFYVLNSSRVQNLMRTYAGLTAIPDLNHSEFYSIDCILPSYEYQIKIANYLDAKTQAIDKKTTLLEQKIDKYKALRKSLINKTITKGLNPNVILKESGIDWIGLIPKHWEVKRIKSFCKTIKGKNLDVSEKPFKNGRPLLTLEYLRNDAVAFDAYNYSKDRSLNTTKDDLIIVWDGAAVGEILKAKNGVVSSTIAKLDFNQRVFSSKYFYYFKDSIDYKLKRIPTGMGIPHLNPNILKNYLCPQPPIEEQKEIADYLDAKTTTIDNIIGNIEKQIEVLTELRKTLINDVVTGKLKVTQE